MKNVLLVFGGVSYEHDISVVTAFQIFKKTKIEDIKLNLLYVSRNGEYFLCNEKYVKLEDFAKSNFNSRRRGMKEVVFVSGEKNKLFYKTRFGLREALNVEVAIFACHGGDGENGRLVTIFEDAGIACSAGSSDALAVCMDKFLFKKVMQGLRLPVVAGVKISKVDFERDANDVFKRVERLKYPLIIKINNGGSSIGMFVANDRDEFVKNLSNAFELSSVVIVEKFLGKTREFNIALVGNVNSFEVSEIDEPLKKHDILTFADKYLAGGQKGQKKGEMSFAGSARELNLSAVLQNKIKNLASKIFVSLGLKGIIRIDFLYDENTQKLYVCEVNAIPGSLAYYFFKKYRLLRNDLVTKLINIAEQNLEKDVIKDDFVVDILNKK